MKSIVLRILAIGMGAFFISAQAYEGPIISTQTLSAMKAIAFRPKLKTLQAHMRVMRAEYVKDFPDLKPVPLQVPMSSGFGIRMHPIYKRRLMHWGIDYPVLEGTPIHAAASGVVLKVLGNGYKSSYGKYIVIAHDDIHKTLYAHLSAIYVKEGDWVEKGTPIGKSGNTGVSTSPHLHFEVIENGKRVNPLHFIKGNIPSPF